MERSLGSNGRQPASVHGNDNEIASKEDALVQLACATTVLSHVKASSAAAMRRQVVRTSQAFKDHAHCTRQLCP
jgi:hypothetical protein